MPELIGDPARSGDEAWMREALREAEAGRRQGEVPVGAVVVLRDECIGRGYNQPLSARDPTAHAEIVALRQAARHLDNYRLLDAVLYVTIEPCAMCAGALLHARIGRLVFGAEEPRAGAVCSHIHLLQQCHTNWRVPFTGNVLADECGAMMRDFFSSRR